MTPQTLTDPGELDTVLDVLGNVVDALMWASGSADFGPDGVAATGWVNFGRPALSQGIDMLNAHGRIAGESEQPI